MPWWQSHVAFTFSSDRVPRVKHKCFRTFLIYVHFLPLSFMFNKRDDDNDYDDDADDDDDDADDDDGDGEPLLPGH